MHDIEELMARLPHIRGVLGWTQIDLAQRVGVSQGTISDWETGEQYPSRRNERILREVLAGAMAGTAVRAAA